MTGASLVAFIGLLVGLLLVIVAMVVYQEAKRRPSYDPLEYVIDDAVKHIAERLQADGKTGLSSNDILRIIEWEIFYMQGLAQDNRNNPVETVAGGHEASVDFIVAEIREKHGVTHSPEDVADVLRYEADYLVQIGAVGEPVAPLEEK
ncbi:MAG TPA: hypothetical protein VIW94_03620 [Acidimicrobiia bacterium]